jgi:hypothetical protein
VAIAEWAHDLPISVRVRLGMGRRAPSESMIHRLLQALDADELDRAVSGWLAARAADRAAADRAPTPATARTSWAALGNLAIGAIHLTGRRDITESTRWATRRMHRAFDLLHLNHT